MQITNASVMKSAADGKITSEIRSEAASTEIGATMASVTTATSVAMDMDMAMTSTTTKSAGSRLERRARGGPEGEARQAPSTIDMTRRFRIAAVSLAAASTLQLTPVIAAETTGDQSQESSISTHAKAFGEAVKRDAKVVGAKSKEGAHRVAVAAKAVGHEVATAAKRGAAATRAAFKGEKSEAPPAN
jgi:hypothetical protein